MLSGTLPPLEEAVSAGEGAELARICNDEMAELLAKYPHDVGNGAVSIRQTIEAIDGMEIPDASKRKIYQENAKNLLHI